MSKSSYSLRMALCLVLAAAPGFGAEDDWGEEKPDTGVPDRRQPSVFHRTHASSPADQLAYARQLRDKGKLQKAGKQYLALVHSWHGSPEAPVAQMEYAELLERKGAKTEAFQEYQYLIDNFTGNFNYEDVLRRQYNIATNLMATPSRFLGLFSDSGNLKDSLPLFEQIVANGPGWENTPGAQFNAGLVQERIGEFEMAIDAYEAVRQRYPASPLAADAAFREGNCLYKMTRERKYEEYSMQLARSHLDRTLKAYPSHPLADSAKAKLAEINSRLEKAYLQRAAFYDRFGRHPRAALQAYTDYLNKFPDAAGAAKARDRVAALKPAAETGRPSSGGPSDGGAKEAGENQ